MPPVAKISKEMILEQSLLLVKNEGIENLNVRNIANELKCSTQPIMYHYKNVDILKEEIYKMANDYHSEYLAKIEEGNDPLLQIGLQYIKFAYEESNLFKFLFQSNKFSNSTFTELINSGENDLEFIFEEIQKGADISREIAKELFENLFISAHGIASLIANNSMKYDELFCKKILENSFEGFLMKIKGDVKNEKNI